MYVLAPYERFPGPGGRPARRVSLARVLPPQAPGQREPFQESEGLGGYAVALVLDPENLAAARRTPGVLAFPSIPLTAKLGEVSRSTRQELLDALTAQGYKLEGVRFGLGRDLEDVSLLRLLEFACSARRKPRVDGGGDVVLDGPPQPTRRLPLPPMAGGAFPTTGVLETFTGSNGTAPPNGNWGAGDIFGTAGRAIEIQSNQANGSNPSVSTGWWSASTFGPDSEVFTTLTIKGSNGHYTGLFIRLTTPGGGTVDGYSFYFAAAAGTDGIEMYRADNGSETLLGSAGTQEFATGNVLGFEAIGSTLKGYIGVSSVYTEIMSRSDATYGSAGYIGLYIQANVTHVDDFGGGTVVVAGTTYEKVGSGILGGRATGVDASTFAESGAAISGRVASGADASTFAEAGRGVSGFVSTGDQALTLNRAGRGVSGFVASGDQALTLNRAGRGVSGFVASGADASTFAESGSGISGSVASGDQALTLNRAGQARSAFVTSGADQATYTETGAAISGRVASGADAATVGRSGAGIAGLAASGADATTYTEAGAGVSGFVASGFPSRDGAVSGTASSGFVASGADQSTFAESGAGVSGRSVSAPRIFERGRLGTATLAGLLAGADATAYARLGSAVASLVASGADVYTASRTGSGVMVTAARGTKAVINLTTAVPADVVGATTALVVVLGSSTNADEVTGASSPAVVVSGQVRV